MIRPTALLSLAVVLAAGGLAACRKKPEPAPVPAPVRTSDDGTAKRRADSLAAASLARRRADSVAAARSIDLGTQSALRRVLVQTVYFDYDKDALRDDARAILDAKASVLNANSSVTLVITGHTDEQGTSEYNLALGQRRAAQVKRYLESKGVAENRLTTQSMGDSQPAVQGSDESAYQLNRRAEFAAQNASGALMRPRS